MPSWNILRAGFESSIDMPCWDLLSRGRLDVFELFSRELLGRFRGDIVYSLLSWDFYSNCGRHDCMHQLCSRIVPTKHRHGELHQLSRWNVPYYHRVHRIVELQKLSYRDVSISFGVGVL